MLERGITNETATNFPDVHVECTANRSFASNLVIDKKNVADEVSRRGTARRCSTIGTHTRTIVLPPRQQRQITQAIDIEGGGM